MSYLVAAFLVVVLAAMMMALLAAALVMTPFALPLFVRGAPFVPTGRKTTERMVSLSGLTPGQRLLDLGSGDGRIVIAAARRGISAHGIELNPWLVWYARWSARWAGLSQHATFTCGNLWRIDCATFDAVTVYGLGPIMPRLERKLMTELKPGARVVSHAFTFPHWKPGTVEDSVYVYETPRGNSR